MGFSPRLKINVRTKVHQKGNLHPRAKACGNSCPSLLKYKNVQYYGLDDRVWVKLHDFLESFNHTGNFLPLFLAFDKNYFYQWIRP
jgi:hypothetical protein